MSNNDTQPLAPEQMVTPQWMFSEERWKQEAQLREHSDEEIREMEEKIREYHARARERLQVQRDFDPNKLPEQDIAQWKKDMAAAIEKLGTKESSPDLDYPDEKRAYLQKWGPLAEQAYQKEIEHVHGPFTFLMNQNHNALRGCQTCGQAWVGLMAGNENNLFWHPIMELPEEEE